MVCAGLDYIVGRRWLIAADSRPFHQDQQEWAAPPQRLREKPGLFSKEKTEEGVWSANEMRARPYDLSGALPCVFKHRRASVGAPCESLGLNGLISHRWSWCKWKQCYLWQTRPFLQRMKPEEQETPLWSLSCLWEQWGNESVIICHVETRYMIWATPFWHTRGFTCLSPRKGCPLGWDGVKCEY